MYANLLIIPLICIITNVLTIWPPPYRIHLNHSEDFVIFETFGSEDSDDIYSDDDEMIKPLDIRSLDISKDAVKYLRIHKLAMKQGRENLPDIKRPKRLKWPETNYDQVKSKAWIAGHFVDNHSNAVSVS